MKRALKWLGIAAVASICAGLVFTESADPALFPASGGQGIPVYVVDHGYHAGLIVPTAALRAAAVGIARRDREQAHVLRSITQDYPWSDWLEIGWGDAGFYRQAPSVTDVSIGLAARALFVPTPSVVHVVPIWGAAQAAFPGSNMVGLSLSQAGFEAMAVELSDTFERDANGAPHPDGASLYGQGAFYDGQASYHVFNTCNHWISEVLRSAGAPSSWIWSMTSGGLMAEISLRTRDVAI